MTPEEQDSFLREQKILVALPCFGGMCHSKFMLAMTGISAISAVKDYKVVFQVIDNESIINKARNILANHFLEDESFTHLMFIDSDIDFNPLDFFKLLLRDKDVVAGSYPKKNLDWNAVKESSTLESTVDDLKYSGISYAFGLKDKDGRYSAQVEIAPDENGLAEVDAAPTGFMLIKRNVFEKFIEQYPDEWYIEETLGNKKAYNFFKCHIDKEQRLYIGEDWTFCQEWKEMGGEVWVDFSVKLKHIGAYTYEGRY